MPPPGNLPLIACLTLLAGCGGADAAPTARVTIDTLPNGAVSVMSEGPTAWADTNGWKLVEDLRYSGGEPGSQGELIQPNGIAIDEVGRMYVADANPAMIKVYGPDGVFLHSIGREGQGPGEFQSALLGIFDSLLIVHDPRTARTTVFDTAGQYVRSWQAGCCYWMWINVDREGRIATPVPDQSDSVSVVLARTSVQGVALDTIVIPVLGRMYTWTIVTPGSHSGWSIPRAPTTDHALLPDGSVIMGYSDTYKLFKISGGDTLRVIRRSWSPEPIPESELDSIHTQMVENVSRNRDPAVVRKAFRKSDMPTTYPAWTALNSDEAGRLWVSTNAGLDVFDQDGIYLGLVTAPGEARGRWSRWGPDGSLYTISIDDDGFPVIARFHVDSSATAVH